MGELIVININNDKRWKPNEPNCVYIGRPSKLSNPYSSKKSNVPGTIQVSSSEQSLKLFNDYFNENKNGVLKQELENIVYLLSKHDFVYLGCFCKPNNCHGDIIKTSVLLNIYFK